MFEYDDIENQTSTNKRRNSFSYNTNLLDGDINCMAIDNNNKILYCGGNFKKSFSNGSEIGLNNICSIMLNDLPQIVSNIGTGVNSFVNCMVVDLVGNLYVGGNFTFVGGLDANYIAKWDGENWSALSGGLSSMPHSMTINNDNELIVCGTFIMADSKKVNHIAKWNGLEWSSLGHGLNGVANSICTNKLGDIFVGGYFTAENENNLELKYIARYSNNSWFMLGTGLESPVTCIAITDQNILYVGGYFTNIGGIPMKHICSWNGTNWCQLGSGINSTPKCLTTYDDKLYVGGCFTNVGGCDIKYIVKWHINDKKWRYIDDKINNSVNSMITDNTGTLYISGTFPKCFSSKSLVINTKLARWSCK
jgi:hypothetical protein